MPAKKVSSLTIPKKYSLDMDGITQSAIVKFMTCRRLFLFYINKLDVPKSGWGAMGFGSLFHAMLDRLYKSGKMPERPEITTWLNEETDIFLADNPMVNMQDMEDDLAVIFPLFTGYVNQYGDIDCKKNFVSVEKTYSAPFGQAKLRMKPDGYFRAENGGLWLMEHKTKSRIDEDGLTLSLGMNFQVLFYFAAAKDYLNEKKNPVGCLYNIVRKPGLRRGKGETLHEFSNRIEVDISARPEWYYIRQEIAFTPKDIDQFQKELKMIIQNISTALSDKRHMYRNTSACLSPFPCPYLANCAGDTCEGLVKREKLFRELDV